MPWNIVVVYYLAGYARFSSYCTTMVVGFHRTPHWLISAQGLVALIGRVRQFTWVVRLLWAKDIYLSLPGMMLLIDRNSAPRTAEIFRVWWFFCGSFRPARGARVPGCGVREVWEFWTLPGVVEDLWDCVESPEIMWQRCWPAP